MSSSDSQGSPPRRLEVDLTVHPDLLLDEAALRRRAAKATGCRPDEVAAVEWLRRSIDARRGRVRIQGRVAVYLDAPPAGTAEFGTRELSVPAGVPEVAIIGAGPAGMACAWALARRGIRAVVFERGKRVRERRHDLAALTQRGELNPESNYCFGEGGAGTFSDGKLYTRAHKRGSVREVLELLVDHGAPSDILVNARPHIGTNRLPKIIGAWRETLAAVGVEIRFSTRVDDLWVEGGELRGVVLADGSRVPAKSVVVATGHSARDVLEMLARHEVPLEAKSFAMGVRIEHPQPFVDEMQYGKLAGHPALGSANYRLVERVGGRGVFSFCMCPGGFIVPATTRLGQQVVNGWSPASRRGRYANSGFVVEVDPALLQSAGFNPSEVFAGIEFQETVERRAFAAGGGAYVAPAQRISDFVEGRPSEGLPDCSYPRGLAATSLADVLGELTVPIRDGLARLGERMPGFAGANAVAVGVESRTSSPVRITRDGQTLESPGLAGLYPCAEGAGYAGGIMSAAIDGIRVAQSIADARSS